MARPKVEFETEGLKRLVAAYKNGAGLVALANQFHRTVPTIRRILTEAGVDIRGRGRPASE